MSHGRSFLLLSGLSLVGGVLVMGGGCRKVSVDLPTSNDVALQHERFRGATKGDERSVIIPGSPWAQTAAPTSPAATMAAATTEPDLTPSRPTYDGRLSELYAIYFRHLVLMLVTLGWSRFWGRTRIRRYLWNHFAILGDRFEY